MNIEHKLIKQYNEFISEVISFCKSEFKLYFKFGNRNTVFFMVADRKPRHGEAFKLAKRAGDGASSIWYFADLNLDEHPDDENESPWPYDFDLYLSDTFDNAKPVYIWVEYE